jgi:predicted RecB family endonuclease
VAEHLEAANIQGDADMIFDLTEVANEAATWAIKAAELASSASQVAEEAEEAAIEAASFLEQLVSDSREARATISVWRETLASEERSALDCKIESLEINLKGPQGNNARLKKWREKQQKGQHMLSTNERNERLKTAESYKAKIEAMSVGAGSTFPEYSLNFP